MVVPCWDKITLKVFRVGKWHWQNGAESMLEARKAKGLWMKGLTCPRKHYARITKGQNFHQLGRVPRPLKKNLNLNFDLGVTEFALSPNFKGNEQEKKVFQQSGGFQRNAIRRISDSANERSQWKSVWGPGSLEPCWRSQWVDMDWKGRFWLCQERWRRTKKKRKG